MLLRDGEIFEYAQHTPFMCPLLGKSTSFHQTLLCEEAQARKDAEIPKGKDRALSASLRRSSGTSDRCPARSEPHSTGCVHSDGQVAHLPLEMRKWRAQLGRYGTASACEYLQKAGEPLPPLREQPAPAVLFSGVSRIFQAQGQQMTLEPRDHCPPAQTGRTCV